MKLRPFYDVVVQGLPNPAHRRVVTRLGTQLLSMSRFSKGTGFHCNFVCPQQMEAIATAYANKKSVTDVLSFPNVGDVNDVARDLLFSDAGDGCEDDELDADFRDLGTMYVCLDYIDAKVSRCVGTSRRQTRRDVYRAAALSHGMLHLLGYRHDSDGDFDAMHAQERRMAWWIRRDKLLEREAFFSQSAKEVMMMARN